MENINFKIIKDGSVTSPKGFKASGIYGGIKKIEKKDVAVIVSDVPAKAAGVFTTNKVAAAPVIVSKKNVEDGEIQAVVANSGNANACTGKVGMENAEGMAGLVADKLGIPKDNVVVASTGVIGVYLDMDKVKSAINSAMSELSYDGGHDAAQAIMTTDTFSKEVAVELEIDGKTVTIGGMAKGSGMIHPNMATMLCFITTDANIEKNLLKKALKSIADDTFNMITVDGDTSTNDMVTVLANGLAGNSEISKEDENYSKFYNALYYVLETLSIMIAKDGEGASKLLTVNILNAATKQDAKKAAKSVIQSSLVKTAMFGEDANWGRILAAIGYSGAEFDQTKVEIYLKSQHGSIKVAEEGAGLLFDEVLAKKILESKEVTIVGDLNNGEASATAWGCDLTYDYVKINGSYRS